MGVGELNADRLESLVELIETATAEYKRAFVRNVNAWVEFALENVVVSPQIEDAAKRALEDALRFGDQLFGEGQPAQSIADGLDSLRSAAIGSIRGLQSLLVEALPARAA